MAKALITTVPFGDKNRLPLEMLEDAGIQYLINPHKTRLTEEQLINLVSDFDVIIAGTEKITDKVMARATNLKLISRVGVGLDGVDLMAAKQRGVRVSYTPEAPAPAVAELTLGLMLALLRSVHIANTQIHQGKWQRIFGRRLAETTLGVIGVGRIGTRVLRRTKSLGTPRILVNDLVPNYELSREFKLDWVTKEQIYKEADIITLHVPLTRLTKNMIRREQLMSMKGDAMIVNVARGGIINEHDLSEVMKAGHLSGAAIDVFEHEPYVGPLAEIDRCLLTAHMGSMSVDCRTRMEIEATDEAVRFLTGQPLASEVPQVEYDVQSQGLVMSNPTEPRSVTVVGGSGFLGSHVADQLSEAGYRVRIYDRVESPWRRQDQNMIVGDLLDFDRLKEAIQGSETVYNFAAIADLNQARDRPLETVRVNILGNAQVLEACRLNGIKRFVYASTVYVYSREGGFYRCSKQAAEHYVEEYRRTYGLDYTILRYGSLYGPRADSSNGLLRIVRAALETGVVRYEGSPDALREYIHVEDAARASVAALGPDFRNQSVVLTGQEPMRVLDLLKMLGEILGIPDSVEFIEGSQPGHYVRTPYAYKPQLGRKYLLPLHVDLGQGLLQLIGDIQATMTNRSADL